MKRLIGLGAMAGLLACWAAPSGMGSAHAAGVTQFSLHYYPTMTEVQGARGSHGNHGGGGGVKNLLYQGGSVETSPVVYIDYWGSAWSSYASAQNYVNGFFGGVGGSSWDKINNQYCQGVGVGTVNCGSSGTHISTSGSQLGGTWNDTTNPLPSRPSQSDIANEAINLMNHIGSYQANATYFVFTPSGQSEQGFGTSWCAWHGVTTSGGHLVAFAYMPYQPDAGAACGVDFVNSGSAGLFDGFSVVGGHEYSEAMTDPHPASGDYGWIDSSGSEIGDKCAWSSSSGDITLGGKSYAVQPLWSNLVSGCAMS